MPIPMFWPKSPLMYKCHFLHFSFQFGTIFVGSIQFWTIWLWHWWLGTFELEQSFSILNSVRCPVFQNWFAVLYNFHIWLRFVVVACCDVHRTFLLYCLSRYGGRRQKPRQLNVNIAKHDEPVLENGIGSITENTSRIDFEKLKFVA